MTTARLGRFLKWAAVPLLCAVIIGVPGIRTPLLRAAGWLLVVEDPLVGPVDVVVLPVNVGGAGVLEAADLVQRGVATRVAVFADPPDEVDREFLRRGVPYEDRTARSIRQLESLGVTAVERIPTAAAGSEDEGEILPAWCDQRQVSSVVVVSTADHSRRMRRLLDRGMKGRPTRVMVRYTRYSEFDPDRWWQTRGGVRTEIVELQKLLLDLLRHPLS
jgi:hypothetical protein